MSAIRRAPVGPSAGITCAVTSYGPTDQRSCASGRIRDGRNEQPCMIRSRNRDVSGSSMGMCCTPPLALSTVLDHFPARPAPRDSWRRFIAGGRFVKRRGPAPSAAGVHLAWCDERAAASAAVRSPLIAVSGGGWPLRSVAINSR